MSVIPTPGSAASSAPSASSTKVESPEPSGYRAIFGKDKKPVPKWVPIALLAFSTAAMAVPIVMLRRHRAATLGKALADAPPPPTRRSSSSGIPIANPSTASSLPSQSRLSASSASNVGPTTPEDNFNGALHCAKAFGIATLLVGVGATTTVWGVRRYMGVETTEEFAHRMRLAILERMPVLSARIHRPPAAEDGEPEALDDTLLGESPTSLSLSPTEIQEWTWPAAEQRLREAFEKDGFSGWAAAALRELEAEGRLERSKRGHV